MISEQSNQKVLSLEGEGVRDRDRLRIPYFESVFTFPEGSPKGLKGPTLKCRLLKLLPPPKIFQVFGIALGFPLEFDGTTILLKTLHALVTGLREIKLMLSRKFLLFWLVISVLNAAMNAVGGKQIFNSLTQL